MNIEAIVFYILLIDAISANLMVQFGSEWYVRHFRTISRLFPPADGWGSTTWRSSCGSARSCTAPASCSDPRNTDRPIFSGTSG
jgi:hypothetical protein